MRKLHITSVNTLPNQSIWTVSLEVFRRKGICSLNGCKMAYQLKVMIKGNVDINLDKLQATTVGTPLVSKIAQQNSCRKNNQAIFLFRFRSKFRLITKEQELWIENSSPATDQGNYTCKATDKFTGQTIRRTYTVRYLNYGGARSFSVISKTSGFMVNTVSNHLYITLG